MSSLQPQTLLNLLGGRYEVLSQLGSGASADVFRVRDLRTGAVRAIKVLKSEHAAANADVLARFEDEFRILHTLHHPHLPEVFDYGVLEDGRRFLVMEIVEGEPLDQYFRAHPDDIWVILYEICETLVFVHARNLLHQDIKPSNILVSRAATGDGERPVVKLIDFGLTYRRGIGAAVQLVGTAEYIAPEVVRGERSLTRAVDYYSLGVTLYELLYGEPPFKGTENQILRAHLERAPHVENEEIEWAELYPHVRALLTKDPQQRLGAFEEFRRAVAGRLTGGIEELDRSYALARIDSLGMIGKKVVWASLLRWLDGPVASAATEANASSHTLSISGGAGVGKRFLTGAFRAEAALRGIRTVLPGEVGVVRSDVAAARQPALMWSQLLEMCERESVVLVVERPTSLPDEERSFVRLAGTQWELYRSRGRLLPLFFLVVVDSTTDDAETLDYLPNEGAIKVELGALGKDDGAQIVDQFRGAMFDTRDARSLVTYLGRFDNAGGAIQGLQRAVLRGGLTFLGQRWKVQPGLLTEIVESHENDSYSRDLVASLLPLERAVASIVAAHPEPVPVSWIAAFLSVEPGSVPAIIAGGLRRLLSVSADSIAPVSSSVRGALRAGCDAAQMRRAHQFLAQRVLELERTVSTDRALAHHYEHLGHVRDAARVHLRLLRAYWNIRPRERPYELIEGTCRSGLELLEAHGSTISPSSRRHLFCFYLKEWIKAFWARNLFTHAKPVIDEWTKRLGESMPASVAPRYVRSMLETAGPEAAQGVLDNIAVHTASKQLRSRFILERALVLQNMGKFQTALDKLATLDDRSIIPRDRHRATIYRAMNLDDAYGMKGDEHLSPSAADVAYREGCIDEAVLMRALRARAGSSQGHPLAALREATLGLRMSHKSGLQMRENFFHRMAATIYLELNDAQRAWNHQQRALQVAGTLGLRYLLGTSWARLSENERVLGRFSNALRYGERGLSLMGADAPARERGQAQAALYGAAVFSRETGSFRQVGSDASKAKLANDRAYYYLWYGRDLFIQRKYREAAAASRRAREEFTKAGYPFNRVWAALQEARITMAQYDRYGYEHLMSWVRPMIDESAPPLTKFEFCIVEVKARYVFRAHVDETLALANECLAMMTPHGNVLLRIELAQALFRLYARNASLVEAIRMFEIYRELVSEVLGNCHGSKAANVAEWFSLGDMVREYGVLVQHKEKRGAEGPPVVESSMDGF